MTYRITPRNLASHHRAAIFLPMVNKELKSMVVDKLEFTTCQYIYCGGCV